MKETEIEQKVELIMKVIKGVTLQDYKTIIRYIDNEVQTKFKI